MGDGFPECFQLCVLICVRFVQKWDDIDNQINYLIMYNYYHIVDKIIIIQEWDLFLCSIYLEYQLLRLMLSILKENNIHSHVPNTEIAR